MNTAISIDQEINKYLSLLNARQKKTVLTVVKTFAEEQDDWWDEISQEQQQAIDIAIAEMRDGKLTPNDMVMKKFKKWLKKP